MILEWNSKGRKRKGKLKERWMVGEKTSQGTENCDGAKFLWVDG